VTARSMNFCFTLRRNLPLRALLHRVGTGGEHPSAALLRFAYNQDLTGPTLSSRLKRPWSRRPPHTSAQTAEKSDNIVKYRQTEHESLLVGSFGRSTLKLHCNRFLDVSNVDHSAMRLNVRSQGETWRDFRSAGKKKAARMACDVSPPSSCRLFPR
jgi:hypothetical protein